MSDKKIIMEGYVKDLKERLSCYHEGDYVRVNVVSDVEVDEKENVRKCILCDCEIDEYNEGASDFDEFEICEYCENNVNIGAGECCDILMYVSPHTLLRKIQRLQKDIDKLKKNR